MLRFKLTILTGLFFFLSSYAEIKLPAIFADNMLLQQQTTVNMWGKATPGKRVHVITGWNFHRYTTASDSKGNWKLSFTTPKAGGPYKIMISDGKMLTLTNVLIGELWLCSGQSNMEMPMRGFKNQCVAHSNMDILKSENSKIRLFRVRRASTVEPQNDVVGRWEEAMPISVQDFSATAYYFGRLLNATLHVPVGLIESSWGGSCIEAWMTKDMLRAFPEIKIPKTDADIKVKNRTPTTLYQAMIHPLVGMTIKGIIWYQGESNYDHASRYASEFETMVAAWRKNWNQPDTIPFYYCQIAPYDYSIITPKGQPVINSAYLREAQMKAESKIPRSGMAVLLDAGYKKGIHPENKQVAGERLALLALNKTYNFQGIQAESPLYNGIEIQGDTVIVHFKRAPRWIYAHNFESKLFKVAGADRVFYPAKAWVVHSKMYVKSDKVKHPVAVRYGFDNYVKGDLYGTGGMPVSSFRSDDWPQTPEPRDTTATPNP